MEESQQGQPTADADALAYLEERVMRAVQLVHELRMERDVVTRDLEAALAAHQQTREELDGQRAETERLQRELSSLRDERSSVKERIEKVLGQLDQMAVS